MSEFRRRLLIHNALKGGHLPTDYIQFDDKEVERICIENWSTDKIGLTYEDAANVKSFNKKFQSNTLIKTFNELQYFTNLILSNAFNSSDFDGCTSLEEVTIAPNIRLPDYSFHRAHIKKIGNLDKVIELGEGVFYICDHLYIPQLSLPNLNGILYRRTFNSVKIDRVENLGNITEIRGINFSEVLFTTGAKSPTFIRFPKTLQKIEGPWFMRNSDRLTKVVSEAVNPPIVSSNLFGRSGQLQSIYVPDVSVDTYKAAPNWDMLADKIKPLSSYVEQ